MQFRVVNLKKGCGPIGTPEFPDVRAWLDSSPHRVYVGRGMHVGKCVVPESPFANPYRITGTTTRTGVTRDDVLRRYERHFAQLVDRAADTFSELAERYSIREFELGCWCVGKTPRPPTDPEVCHAEVMARCILKALQDRNVVE